MAATVLISFLGRGITPRDPLQASPSGYQSATYRFPSGQCSTATFFGWSALQSLRTEHPRQALRWIILGTTGSTWMQLLDVVTDASQDRGLHDAAMAWAERCTPSAWAGPAAEQLLAEGSELLHRATGCQTELDLVTAEPASVFAAIEKHVAAEQRVVLDITHGWRILPVAAIMAIDALRWLKNVRLEGIIYGAFDFERTKEGHVPVVDLRGGDTRELDDFAEPLAVLELTGQYGPLARFFPDCKSDLERASVLESLNRLGQARALARKAHQQLTAGAKSADPLRGSIARRLSKALAWSMEPPDAAVATLASKARFHATHQEWLRAAVLAFEAALLAAAPQRDFGGEAATTAAFDDLRREARRALRDRRGGVDAERLADIRNCAAHSDLGFAESHEQRNAPRDARDLERLIEQVLRLAESLERERTRGR